MTGLSRSISSGGAFPSGVGGVGVGSGAGGRVVDRGANRFLIGENTEDHYSSSSRDYKRILLLSFYKGTRIKAPRVGVGGEGRGGARLVERKRVGLLK